MLTFLPAFIAYLHKKSQIKKNYYLKIAKSCIEVWANTVASGD